MLTSERLQEIRHIAPTAGPLGLEAINELLAEVERIPAIRKETAGDAITLCADEIGEIYGIVGYAQAQDVANWLHDMAGNDRVLDWVLRMPLMCDPSGALHA